MSENKADLLPYLKDARDAIAGSVIELTGKKMFIPHRIYLAAQNLHHAIAVAEAEHASAALAAPQPAAPLGEVAFKLSCQEQFDLAAKIAANVGYVLVVEPHHPDSPHRVKSAEPLGRDAIIALLHEIDLTVGTPNYGQIADAILAIPQERGVERAAIIEECAKRAQEIADSYRHTNGHATDLTLVIEGVVKAIRALGKETGR